MCTTAVQTVFTVILAAGFVITMIAFCTPGWRNIYWEGGNATATDALKDKDYSMGLVSSLCGNDAQVTSIASDCEENFKSKPTWEKIVIASMCLALVAELVAMAWSVVVCYVCCCKSCLAPPLPILTGVAALCLLIAIAVYAGKTGSFDEITKPPQGYDELKGKNSVGYSLWLAIGAMLIMIVDTIVGVILCTTAAVSPV